MLLQVIKEFWIIRIKIQEEPDLQVNQLCQLQQVHQKQLVKLFLLLKGKLEGVAMRVPTPNVSLVELVFCTKKDLSIEKINSAFQNFSKKNKILEITKEKLVSIDFNHNPASSIVDASLTNVVGKNMGKISAWYDNEWGFSNRMCDIAEYLHKIS